MATTSKRTSPLQARINSSITTGPTAEQLERRTLLSAATDATGFYVPAQLQGQTPVTLHPVESVEPGERTRVSFGVPFPRGFLPTGNLATVKVFDGAGAEQAASVQMLTPWRDLGALADEDSVRSALVQVEVAFPDADNDGDADPAALRFAWGGAARAVADLAAVPVRDTWVLYDNAAAPAGTDFKAADGVYEPNAYAVFTPEWYGASLLKARLQPLGSDPQFASYESWLLDYARTAVNDVDPRVTDGNLMHYASDYEPWLYDRAMTLYQLAFRSGSVTFLRHAHRNAQFYANHIDAGGHFDMRGYGDIKYTYGESISANYWLAGDPRLPDVHRRMMPGIDRDFDAAYTPGDMWTERNAGYKLLGYVTGYELLGDPAIGRKAQDTFATYLHMQDNPVPGAPENGLLMHRSVDHIEGGSEFVASPWMTALLVDAAERYYAQSGDARVGTFVTRIADGINRIGESMYYHYDVYNQQTWLVPFYLAGPGLTEDQHAQDYWADREHAADVGKIFALAYYFTWQAGAPSEAYLGRFRELAATADAAFEHWHRPGGPASGLTEYRLNPPRKFNWWFKNTANSDWMLGGEVPQPPPPDTAAPTASAAAADVTGAGGATHAFTVTYADNVAVAVSSFGTGDVLVTGPNGFAEAAAFVSTDSPADGTPRTATYRITAPGGAWDQADNGTYQVALAVNEVVDTAGNAAAPGVVATFAANLAAPSGTAPTASAVESRTTSAWPSHWFTVTYFDEAGVDTRSIGSGDVTVTGPAGYAQNATLSNRVASSDRRQVTATYRITAPGGSWDRSDNGTYLVSVEPAQVSDVDGEFVAAGVVGRIFADIADATAPTAGPATPLMTSGTCRWFTVRYDDDTGVRIGTLDGSDVRVTGPDGYSALAALSNLSADPDGRGVTVTYRVEAPGGSWDVADYGTYTLALVADQVADVAGNYAAARTLGTFDVAAPVPPPPPGTAGPVLDSVTTGGSWIGSTSEGQLIDLSAAYSDADAGDTHTVAVKWGDGTTTGAAAGTPPGTATASHAYADGGVYDVTVTVTDSTGRAASAATRVFVTGAGVFGGVLRVVGTAAADTIRVTPSTDQIVVAGAFLPGGRRSFAAAEVAHVVILGGAGDDYLSLYDTVAAAGILDGGEGNDALFGGLSSLLIGGAGADRINGAGGNDILVSGATRLDGDLAALLAVRNGSRSFAAGEVLDDGAVDTLNGNKGFDRYYGRFASGVLDTLNDLYRTPDEAVIEI